MAEAIYHNILNSMSPLIMGILNVTPDSFSDGGKYFSKDKAILHAEYLIESGADIIDIGGESSRPGSKIISTEEEIDRVIPVVKDLIDKYPDVVISIDTTKSEVAGLAIESGAKIINDISGGTFDIKMFDVAEMFNSIFVIMHMKGTPQNMQINPQYHNVIDEINNYFEERIQSALGKGISNIILDPGIGFGKRSNDNYNILKNCSEFKKLGYPIMIGTSRKSFLGNSLSLEVSQRENATIISETIAVLRGAKIIRTHNVKNAVELKKMISFMNLGYESVNV